MAYYSIGEPPDLHLFYTGYIMSVYPHWDLSDNLYTTLDREICSSTQKLDVYRKGMFRDEDTKVLMVYGTEHLIRMLGQFKKFLDKYQNLNKNI
jgi:hypothetical protein